MNCWYLGTKHVKNERENPTYVKKKFACVELIGIFLDVFSRNRYVIYTKSACVEKKVGILVSFLMNKSYS